MCPELVLNTSLVSLGNKKHKLIRVTKKLLDSDEIIPSQGIIDSVHLIIALKQFLILALLIVMNVKAAPVLNMALY